MVCKLEGEGAPTVCPECKQQENSDGCLVSSAFSNLLEAEAYEQENVRKFIQE